MPFLPFIALIISLCAPVVNNEGSEDGTNDTPTYCVNIGEHNYCNITKGWIPRITQAGGIAAIVVPTLLAAIVLAFNLYQMGGQIKNVYNKNKEDEKYGNCGLYPVENYPNWRGLLSW